MFNVNVYNRIPKKSAINRKFNYYLSNTGTLQRVIILYFESYETYKYLKKIIIFLFL